VKCTDSPDDTARIGQLYRKTLQRPPTAREIAAGLEFIRTAHPAEAAKLPKYEPILWSYGYGEFDETANSLKNFAPLPYFTGDSWQGGTVWPDEKLGWARLTADGGHTGNDQAHAVIRRWTAPEDGTYEIKGQIKHAYKEGVGVRARIIAAQKTLLGTWTVHNSESATTVDSVVLKQGDAVDFLAELPGKLEHNEFTWTPVITARNAIAESQTWNAKKEFSGPPEPPVLPLDTWQRYAQVLLLANEFIFVD
jgi:hypothetical protein